MQLEWRLAGNRAPLGLFFHAGGLPCLAVLLHLLSVC